MKYFLNEGGIWISAQIPSVSDSQSARLPSIVVGVRFHRLAARMPDS